MRLSPPFLRVASTLVPLLIVAAACSERQPTAPPIASSIIPIRVAPALSISPTTWAATGPGTVTLVSDGSASDPSMKYALYGSAVFSTQTWSFSTIASTTGAITVNWDYSGFHAFYQVIAFIHPFVIHNSSKSYLSGANYGPANCCSAPSNGFNYTGSTTFNVTAGDSYGFEIGGRNYDSNSQLTGTLTVTYPDNTPPVIAPTVTGTLGANGWYTSNVGVSWSVTDPESAVSSTTGCGASTLSTDSNGVTYTCSATSAGGTASQSVTVKRDASPPSVTPTVSGTLGLGGWYTSNVSVSWAVSAGLSGVASTSGCTATSTSTDNAGTTYSCTATNGAGLSTTKSVTAKRDATKPVIGYTGNAGSYTVDQTVAITCSASDAMSGLASTTCANVNGDAYTFALGTNTFSASAQDNAGNTNSATTQFTVQVTAASLCALATRWESKAGVAHAMCKQLTEGEGDDFTELVRAQSGKSISAANANILITLYQALAPAKEHKDNHDGQDSNKGKDGKDGKNGNSGDHGN